MGTLKVSNRLHYCYSLLLYTLVRGSLPLFSGIVVAIQVEYHENARSVAGKFLFNGRIFLIAYGARRFRAGHWRILMSTSRRSRDLWVQALETFSEEERALVDFGDTNLLDVLNSVAALADDKKKQCLQNRWSVKVFGRKVILRDVFSKICIWIQKFKEIADVVVQYDPAHAALPWAGVRLLLQVGLPSISVFRNGR